jgi:hypothetical protein
MTAWEYRARIFFLDKDDKLPKEYIQQNYPNWKWNEIPERHPVTLEAYLNHWGAAGWELVSIESGETVGNKGDLGLSYSQGYCYRYVYHCVFKRQKSTETSDK